MEKCYTFKGQSLEKGLSCIFQAIGNILLQKVHDLASMTKHRKRNRSDTESDLFFPITLLQYSSCPLFVYRVTLHPITTLKNLVLFEILTYSFDDMFIVCPSYQNVNSNEGRDFISHAHFWIHSSSK